MRYFVWFKDAENGKPTDELSPIAIGIRRETKAIFGIDYDCPKCVSFSLKNRANVTLEREVRQVFMENKWGVMPQILLAGILIDSRGNFLILINIINNIFEGFA